MNLIQRIISEIITGFVILSPLNHLSNSSSFSYYKSKKPGVNLEHYIDYYIGTEGRKVSFQRSLNRVFERQDPYMRLCIEYSPKFRKEGCDISPDSLFSLIIDHEIVESRGETRATSNKNAVGNRQFMYYTGKFFDLKDTKIIDERLDPIKSTRATLDFLLDHTRMFGSLDWALLSYNSGPGLVRRLREKYSSPFEIKREDVCRETYDYLRKISAVRTILNNKDIHGIEIKARKINFVYHKIKKGDNLYNIAKRYNVDVENLMNYNPFKSKTAIPVGYTMTIPIQSL